MTTCILFGVFGAMIKMTFLFCLYWVF